MSRLPKILAFDLETDGVNAFKGDLGWIISVSYKFIGEGKVKNILISDFPKFKKHPHDDSTLLKAFYKIAEKADFFCAHYGERFDNKFVNTRLKNAGLPRIAPKKLLDTWRVAKTHFNLHSNRLDNLAKFLKCKHRKLPKGDGWPNWWYDFLSGNPSANTEKMMRLYTNDDVLTLEECALKMRDYWPKWINYSIFLESDSVCRACGSENIQHRGWAYQSSGKKKQWVCKDCGAWSLSKSSKFTGGLR